MEEQFEVFREQLEESGAVRERLRAVAGDLDNAVRALQAALLPVHHAAHSPAAKAKAEAPLLGHLRARLLALRPLYAQLAAIVGERPGQYYRYHDHWRSQTQAVVFLLAFVHWLDTRALLSHAEVEAHLALTSSDFRLDIEDYLIGLCNVSNELPRYVVNRVTAGDYDCPREVASFLSELYSAFRVLNLRNDVLRKRFDGLKYDLKKVEEVLYDVKIRGLLSTRPAEGAVES